MEINNIKQEVKQKLNKVQFYNECEFQQNIFDIEVALKELLPEDKIHLIDDLEENYIQINKLHQNSVIDYVFNYINKSTK